MEIAFWVFQAHYDVWLKQVVVVKSDDVSCLCDMNTEVIRNVVGEDS